eukprot:gene28934-34922_t
MRAFFLQLLLLISLNYAGGFTGLLSLHRFALFSSNKNLIEDGVSLRQLINHEKEANFLSSGLKDWLDKEYVSMDVHRLIGEVVGDSYLDARKEGVDDLGHLVMHVGTRLESEEISDAFVNSWDIANKVSDMLLVLLDRETCSCAGDLSFFLDRAKQLGLLPSTDGSSKIQQINELAAQSRFDIDVKRFKTLQRELKSGFARYQTIKNFLEDEVPFSDINIVMALTLGFQLVPDFSIGSFALQQNSSIAPLRWQNLPSIPDFSNVQDVLLDEKMMLDLPKEAEHAELIFEAVAGMEAYKRWKAENSPVRNRKILITKWLSVHNFFSTSHFPYIERYVPAHTREELESEEAYEDSDEQL